MRIICPNCAAEYEVEAEMIPDAGRDVQCSACGHTWMQFRDGHAEEIAVHAPVMAPAEEEAVDSGDTVEPAPPARRQIDDETRRILKEEAEREATARRARRRAAEASLETQGDLGLNEAPVSELGADASEDTDPAPVTRAESRSDRLPDIEEINSTLDARPTEQHDNSHAMTFTDETDTTDNSGFRGGFIAMIVIALVLIALYLLAPRLAEGVPALEPVLSAYVDGANGVRQMVNNALQSAADAIGGIAGSPDAGS